MRHRTKLLALMSGAGAVLTLAGQAQAAGTLAGTTINNTANVAYSVGGVSQPTVASNTATFTVSRRVNLAVAKVGAATQVAPGSTSQVVAFTVTNTTNSALDFRLVAAQEATGTSTAFSKTDSFDTTNVRVFVDTKGTGIYDAAVDTTTFIDGLAPDTTKTVFVISDTPAALANGAVAGISLTAVAAANTTPGTLGADLTQTSGAGNLAGIDTVFADGAGITDVARDGKASDHSEYDVVSATIALVKSAKVISDPLNNTTNPKAIPGAVMEYCIQVQNTGSATASGVSVSDVVPANTTFVSGSIFGGGTVTGSACNADGSAVTDATGFNSGTVTVAIPTVAAAATSTARFRVTVN